MSRLPDPVFAEATGVLKMIAKDPEKRWQYEMRLKAERDARAKLQQAIADGLEMGLEQGVAQGLEKGLEEGREKGLAEGLAEGELIGRVKLLQSLNGDTPAASEDLQKLGRQQLTELESELQRRLNKLLGRQ
jgi:flagellar biosynthesis/type III secretory pathway protein FliH